MATDRDLVRGPGMTRHYSMEKGRVVRGTVSNAVCPALVCRE
jgi:hypothetical protein